MGIPVLIMGESGSGKSTIIKAIMGLLGEEGLVTKGDIWYLGESLTDMSEKKLTQYRRKHLGYVFQMYNLIPNLSVRENIEVGAYFCLLYTSPSPRDRG